MAKLGSVIDEWMTANELSISAVQCWTSLEEYFGVVPCTVMSMMSNNLIPSESHVTLAWGRDYGDVSPVRGVILGGRGHKLNVGVDLEPIDE